MGQKHHREQNISIPRQTFWKDGDEFMGDPGGEERGLNSVFDSDESTWNVIEKNTR